MIGHNAKWAKVIVGNLMAYCKASKQMGIPSFKVEEFRNVAENLGWPMPAPPTLGGSLPYIAIKQGLIEWDGGKIRGQHIMAQCFNAHHRYIKVWQVL